MPSSLPYHPFLISHLKNPERSAGLLTVIFEEKDPEPELLEVALKNVFEALGEPNMTPEEAKLQLEKLDKILSENGSNVIYNLAEWLQKLGLKLTVTVAKEQEVPVENQAKATVIS
ncbi:transcriptional regulator [Ancylothrix sp. C2]|uniref:helix-turn-helix domain-containing transcriptional regulator n=1 Tax=Ancylothrix sp. D3o TaxID=2953691 RepID=UPI0021BB40DC|nr:transcriptional regulator [Ancylothrix sp. D3o]MCT7949822.1 transcriptional regulator [Ancylothrix sp. D3o]